MITKTISVDAMGGDHGPRVVVPAVIRAMRKYSSAHFILVGKEDLLRRYLRKCGADKFATQWSVVNATEVVDMDESPSNAMKNKKDSSMRVALNIVKEERADACVSAGNTGALMATARFVLKTLPGISRPAIMTKFPSESGKPARVLDLGANVDSTAEQLFEFAVMGSVAVSAVEGIKRPKVYLLNVGEEDIKGNEQVKQTAELLADTALLHYAGYIEADKIFKGVADVVVCDGFVGNVLLKSIEGTMKFAGRVAKDELKKNWLTRVFSVFAIPLLWRLKKRIDPRNYNGATFLGLNHVVIKSHGGTDEYGFFIALEEALRESEKNLPELIREQVAGMLHTEEVVA